MITSAIIELVRTQNPQVLLIGENHFDPNVLHEIGLALVPELKALGFDCFCVEVLVQDAALKPFLAGEETIEWYQENTYQSSSVPESPGSRTLVSKSYCELLLQAQTHNLEVMPIDTRTVDHVMREAHLYNQVSMLLKRGGKPIVWIGNGHTARRKKRSIVLTLAEQLDEASFRLLTFAQVARGMNDDFSERETWFGQQTGKEPIMFLAHELPHALQEQIAARRMIRSSIRKEFGTIDQWVLKFADWDATIWCPFPQVHNYCIGSGI